MYGTPIAPTTGFPAAHNAAAGPLAAAGQGGFADTLLARLMASVAGVSGDVQPIPALRPIPPEALRVQPMQAAAVPAAELAPAADPDGAKPGEAAAVAIAVPLAEAAPPIAPPLAAGVAVPEAVAAPRPASVPAPSPADAPTPEAAMPRPQAAAPVPPAPPGATDGAPAPAPSAAPAPALAPEVAPTPAAGPAPVPVAVAEGIAGGDVAPPAPVGAQAAPVSPAPPAQPVVPPDAVAATAPATATPVPPSAARPAGPAAVRAQAPVADAPDVPSERVALSVRPVSTPGEPVARPVGDALPDASRTIAQPRPDTMPVPAHGNGVAPPAPAEPGSIASLVARPLPAAAPAVTVPAAADAAAEPPPERTTQPFDLPPPADVRPDAGGRPAAASRPEPLALRTAETVTGPAEQIAVHVGKALGGGFDRIRVQLHPLHLGHVDIRLETTEQGRVDVVVRAERPETLELLQRDARELVRLLQESGLGERSANLEFQLSGQGRGDRERADGDDGTGGPERAQDEPTDEPALRLTAAAGRIDIRI